MSDSMIRTLLALVWLYAHQPTVTVRDVMRARGFRSPGSTFAQLRRLQDLGLIAWEHGKAGTLRPLVERVA